MAIFLYEGCEIVDVAEEADPDVVGGGVVGELGLDVVSAFFGRLWKKFFE